MRIGLISDLHVDLNRLKGEDVITPALAREVRRRALDILLIAGDISSDHLLTLATIDALSAESGARILFIPGNHDLWNEKHPELGAWDAYNRLLAHPANLARAPVLPGGDWAIVGDVGWYDFTYGDPSFTLEEFQNMQYGERTWQDKIKSVWDRSTRAMHELFMERLEKSLDQVRGRKLLMATHVVQIPEFTVSPAGKMWKYFNAFLGSPDYGRLAIGKGVLLSVCGHVHYRRTVGKGDTEFVCPCLGYTHEWPAPPDPEKEIARTLVVYELGEEGATRVE